MSKAPANALISIPAICVLNVVILLGQTCV